MIIFGEGLNTKFMPSLPCYDQKNQNIQASGKCRTLGGLVYQLNVPAAVQVSGGVAIPVIQAGKCDDKQHLDDGLS
jgi:hypothetical protein